MAINILVDSIITAKEAIHLLPKSPAGKRINLAVLHSWFRKGLKASNGELVRLEFVETEDETCTSREALKRFFQRLNCR